ncbi:MAG: beta-N-acetylhexosaminidase [Syntrophobacter sp.]
MYLDEPGLHVFVGFKGAGIDEELKYLLTEFRPGGIVLFKRNIECPEQVRNLVADAQAFSREHLARPLLIAIDQEGGTVQRLAPHFTQLPAARTLAAQGREAVSHWASIAAADLAAINIHINFAPVLDIAPEGVGHFMESRSLGSSPAEVSDLGGVYIRALQEQGVSATAKHFPGLGRAELDPHHFAPVIQGNDPEKFQEDLMPFQAAVTAGVHCFMTSHAIYPGIDPGLPATLSHEINYRILREKMGFRGTLFSDDLDMAAISEHYSPREVAMRGLACGTDFFLLCQRSESIEPFSRALSDLIRDDASLRQALKASRERIAALFQFHFHAWHPSAHHGPGTIGNVARANHRG